MTDRSLGAPADLDGLVYDDRGLVPVVAQDAVDGRVLMVAWANREALERTLATGRLHFWSRSRSALWMKGETSGHLLSVVTLHADCDGDTILARVRPAGPSCHTGEDTCFGEGSTPDRTTTDGVEPHAGPAPLPTADLRSETVLPEVWATLQDRAVARPEGSYTVRLLDDPNLRIKKLGEETAELIQALVQGDGPRATEEAADLFYHTLTALLAADVSLDDLLGELERRR